MPRAPRVSGRRIARALEKAGFDLIRVTGDHAYLHHPQTNRRAVVPLTSRTCPIGTLHSILRQAGLTSDELQELLG